MNSSAFSKLVETWQALGQEDPLWAIASQKDKRGGKWDLPQFLQSGEEDVNRYYGLLRNHAGAPESFQHVFDFGCGVGRLALAWRRHAQKVTGVDISESMISYGQKLTQPVGNVELLVNQREDLADFAAGEFDLVFSHICLQHMPYSLAARYIAEFSRVCQRQGWVAFQLPARNLGANLASRLRKQIVDALPFHLGAAYRRWRHGSTVMFDMFFTPPERVLATASKAGLKLAHQERDYSAGASTEGWIYLFRKTMA